MSWSPSYGYCEGPSARQQILPPGYDTLGYTNRIQEQWSREFDPTRLHRNEIAGGPLTKSYENLDDDQLWKSPLDEVYAELGIGSGTTPSLTNITSTNPAFAVYSPKTSSEYFSTISAPPSSIGSHRSSTLGTYRLGAPSSLRPSLPYSSSITNPSREDDHDRWRNTDRQTLLDYKGTQSQSPFSAHLYQGGVQRQDSRIVGSNFVQLTTRPKDRFLEKLDKTLADIRSEPRY